MTAELFFNEYWFWLSVTMIIAFIWAPKTWTPGELVSAASMNTNIRDHLNENLRTQATALTGNQNNLALEGPFANLKCSNASELVITGALVDSGNLDGAKIYMEALDQKVILKNQNASSTTSNRIITPYAKDLALSVFDRLLLIYDGTTSRWRASVTTREMIGQSLHGVNLLADPTYLIWPAGDAADPAHWTSSGAGVAIAREATIRKKGLFSAKLTYGAACAYLDQDILPTADYDDGFDGEEFSFGAWIYTNSSDMKIGVEDGVLTTGYSAAHAGDSAWAWLTGSHTIDSGATKITFRCKLNAAGIAYISWPTLIKGSIPPPAPLWPRIVRGELAPTLSGDPLGTGTELWADSLGRPFIVEDVQIECISDGVGQAMILDINHWNGAAWNSMFNTKPEIAVGDRSGGEQPDGTYRYRCFAAGFGTSVTNARIGIDCDQAANSGAKNPTVNIRALQFQRPQELLLGYNSVK